MLQHDQHEEDCVYIVLYVNWHGPDSVYTVQRKESEAEQKWKTDLEFSVFSNILQPKQKTNPLRKFITFNTENNILLKVASWPPCVDVYASTNTTAQPRWCLSVRAWTLNILFPMVSFLLLDGDLHPVHRGKRHPLSARGL